MMMIERSFLFVAGGIFPGFAKKIRQMKKNLKKACFFVNFWFVYNCTFDGLQLCT